ncbi:MAG: ABC transporter substrate-binding protein [Acidimicrobiia bacterium]|nr:ABC transporter substrate-binding protein [Acidimicrobiia bacterium]
MSDHQIRLGIPIFDLGNLPVNGINPAQQEAQWNSYLDAVNKAGGVEGRQLVPVYAGYNPLQEDSSRAACLALTQDTQVFAVLAYGLFDNQVGCFSQEHAVPLVNGIGVSDATMAASGRRMLTVNISKDRALRDQALLVAQMGVLQGKTVGIVTSTDRNDNASVDAALVPTLRQLGVKVAHTSNLSSDEGTALAQLPVEVRAMQAAGVNVVFLAANLLYSGYFVEDADSQGYHPQYTTSDFEQLVEDGETNMFTAGFDGAIGITALRSGEQRVGDAEPPFDARCRQIYQSASGESYQRGDLEYDTTEAMCSVVDITAKALALASPSLTRAGFIAAAETLNNFDLAYSAPGSFSVTKHDAPQSLRVARWHYACKCWVPTSAFAPAPS